MKLDKTLDTFPFSVAARSSLPRGSPRNHRVKMEEVLVVVWTSGQLVTVFLARLNSSCRGGGAERRVKGVVVSTSS